MQAACCIDGANSAHR